MPREMAESLRDTIRSVCRAVAILADAAADSVSGVYEDAMREAARDLARQRDATAEERDEARAKLAESETALHLAECAIADATAAFERMATPRAPATVPVLTVYDVQLLEDVAARADGSDPLPRVPYYADVDSLRDAGLIDASSGWYRITDKGKAALAARRGTPIGAAIISRDATICPATGSSADAAFIAAANPATVLALVARVRELEADREQRLADWREAESKVRAMSDAANAEVRRLTAVVEAIRARVGQARRDE